MILEKNSYEERLYSGEKRKIVERTYGVTEKGPFVDFEQFTKGEVLFIRPKKMIPSEDVQYAEIKTYQLIAMLAEELKSVVSNKIAIIIPEGKFWILPEEREFEKNLQKFLLDRWRI